MKYKNLTDQELVVPGVGVFLPGGEIITDVIIENSKIAKVVEKAEENIISNQPVELVEKKLTQMLRSELDQVALSLGLNPKSYSNKTKLIAAIEAVKN